MASNGHKTVLRMPGTGWGGRPKKRCIVRLGKTRVIVRYLGRRNISAMFNCPNKTVLGMCSRLCGRHSRVHRVLASRRRKTTRTTSKCTETAKGIKIYLTADKPNTAGLMAKVTATCVSSVPVITVAYGINIPLLKGSDFRRVSVTKMAVPVAGCDCVIGSMAGLTRAVEGTFHVTGAKEPKPILVSVPGSIATGIARCRGRCPNMCGQRMVRSRRRSLGGTIRVVRRTREPCVFMNNKTILSRTDGRLCRFTRGMSTPMASSLVKGKTFPKASRECAKVLKVRKAGTSGFKMDRYSLLVMAKTEFDSHMAKGATAFTGSTGVLRVSVSPTRVSGGIVVSLKIMNSVGTILGGVGRRLPRRSRPR